MQGLITSIYELGCLGGTMQSSCQLRNMSLTVISGCIVSFGFSERFGRKRPIFLGTVLVIIGAVIQAAAYGRVQFIIGRIIAGVGTGLNTSIVPIWWDAKSSKLLFVPLTEL